VVTFSPGNQPAKAGYPEIKPATALASDAPEEKDATIASLQQRLAALERDNRINLQALQISNQELQSINDKLQGSNEALEVSNEEVESLNEELRSINAELEAKIQALSHTNDDLKNLFDNAAIAVLFLKEDMRIKGFTEAARPLLGARDSGIGRSFDELATNLADSSLTTQAQAVLADLRRVTDRFARATVCGTDCG